MPSVIRSLYGRLMGIGQQNQLVSNGINVTQPCVDATITVGAEVSNVRAITIQLKDARGNDINYVETVEILVFTDATMTAFVGTGGSTGIAIGTDGALLALVAKKVFLATSEADGDIDLTWTDTGTEQAAVGVRLPNGRVVVSAAFANT
ncbi:MAG TPA: hypothetical protein DCZ11_12460 [Gammaproteobacteria bacterium]|nr:hypothetical protein [Gammaproteobacteria bacterium]MCH79236.1 hypothetical protein [Gammaproteobacteria bacterium]